MTTGSIEKIFIPNVRMGAASANTSFITTYIYSIKNFKIKDMYTFATH